MQFIVDLELDYLSKLVQQLTKVIYYLLFAELCLYISGELCVSTSYREAVLTTKSKSTRRVPIQFEMDVSHRQPLAHCVSCLDEVFSFPDQASIAVCEGEDFLWL